MKVLLNPKAKSLLERRYLIKNESPFELFQRVAHAIACNNRDEEEQFLQALCRLEFLPNSPTLMNAGTQTEQLLACFVLPVGPSLSEAFETLKTASQIQLMGGGTGFSFSKIKKATDLLGMLKIINLMTELIRDQGRRRGAHMGVLPVSHPAIKEFIEAKKNLRNLTSFNLSVGVTDDFMVRTVSKSKEAELFNLIAKSAWKSGEPGLIFLNQIERTQPLPFLGKIEATNPCGEVPLFPNEACVLGSVNLARMIQEKRGGRELDFDKLRKIVRLGVRFLDNTIDKSIYPNLQIDKQVKATRKIGLGVMGFYEMLGLLKIPYDSKEAIETGEEIMRFISQAAWEMSAELAKEKGAFPAWEESRFVSQKPRVRNATLTAIAPTGSISMIAGTSPGIEPFTPNRLILRFPWKVHLQIQQAFQKHTDNSVSKTVNLPPAASVNEVKKIFLQAWKMKLKGITVYRVGSHRFINFQHCPAQF